MLARIDLRHFKCFEELKLPLRPLTLLSGTNASGKSSIMHALVVLHQTMREHEWSTRLILNGSAVRLGTATDVIDEVHGRRSFGVTLFDDPLGWFDWEFEGERGELSMAVQSIRGETETGEGWNADGSQPLRYLLPDSVCDESLTRRLCALTYLTAERQGPQAQYRYDDPQLTPVVGPRGEFAVSLVHSGRDARVLDELVIPDVPPTRFRQVEARMARFFPGCVLEIQPVRRTETVTLGIRLSAGTNFHRPTHTGFGLTQVLPIVVATLSANAEDLLLIENPEVHLHPAGQAQMGHFLAEVAAAGVQVVIETHSDHVLNGVRRAVKDTTLAYEATALHFFRRRKDGRTDRPQVESPSLDARGNIDNWPDGFFDQFDSDMSYFADWG